MTYEKVQEKKVPHFEKLHAEYWENFQFIKNLNFFKVFVKLTGSWRESVRPLSSLSDHLIFF
jgi:hypothetical protein